jgi:putative FmdB family regulatory protein
MPIYEYECDDCGHRFERHQSITSGPVKRCPHCGGAVRRVIYPVGIIFKGPGFYATDHRPAPASEREKGPAKEESKGSERSKIADEGSEG